MELKDLNYKFLPSCCAIVLRGRTKAYSDLSEKDWSSLCSLCPLWLLKNVYKLVAFSERGK